MLPLGDIGVDITLDARERLRRLGRLLASDPLAPTAVRDPRRIQEDHVADSLVALGLAAVRAAGSAVDIGSGAGLPALPLAIALPTLQMTALESNARKVAFIARVIGELRLENARVVEARAEAWPPGLGRFDLVTARAVAPLDVVAEYAAPLLRLGGALVAWRGRRDPAAEAAGERAARLLGLELAEVRAVRPYAAAQHRHLHVLCKVAPTPDRFPRRVGMARKRPLGGNHWRHGSDRQRQ